MQYLYKVHSDRGLPPSYDSAVQLNGFSVTTTSGTVQVNWGDNTSDTLTSGILINHTFLCPNGVAAAGFWNNIEPCPDFPNNFFMFKVHDRENLTVGSKNLSLVENTAPFVVVSAANPITGGLYYEPPIPSVTFTINYFTTNTTLSTFAPGGPFNSRPRINTFRSDGSFVTVLTATSSVTVTMPMTTTYIPYFTAGIDLFFGDWQYCKIEPTNTGWINRPGTLNPGESALQFTIDVQKETPGVGRVTTWNNKAFTFNVTISSPGVP